MKNLRTLLPTILCGSIALLASTSQGATFTWGNTTGVWSDAARWTPAGVPPATDPTTVLVFGGNVGGPLDPSTAYISTYNLPATQFLLNELRFQGTDPDPLNSGRVNRITGSTTNTLVFKGTDAEILQNGTANFAIEVPIAFDESLTFGGTGASNSSNVTINSGISGTGDILKTGSTTFRFGTLQPAPGVPAASSNTWMGSLIIEDGTVRFNNNAQSASSALRANPVFFIGDGIDDILSSNRDEDDQDLGYETSLRMGTLNGNVGAVFAGLTGNETNNYDIVITALHSGNFGGSVTLPAPLVGGTGDDPGDFVVRGPGTQTLSGTLSINKDVIVGYGTTVVLNGGATLASQASGAITFAGGTVKLDNSNGQHNGGAGRLRDSNRDSTTIEAIGGGTLQLIGAPTGTTSEITGRLMLGSFAGTANESKPRSGHLNIQVVPTGTGTVELKFGSYERDQRTLLQFSTVEFAALDSTGSYLGLGGTTAKVFLGHNADPLGLFTPPMLNNLLSTTDGPASVGWATVRNAQGTFFASHGANGVVGITGDLWNGTSSPTANTRVTGSATTQTGVATHEVNSIRLAPVAAGGALDIQGATTLSTTAILLSGAFDYAINSTSGSIGGNGPRFFHVQSSNLTVNARINGTSGGVSYPIVKSGEGTLTLTNGDNVGLNQPVVINQGAIRATPGSSLPQGEIRLRGGQLEIVGGGTFSRPINYNTGSINWSGIAPTLLGDQPVDEDRGSGGFAAIGADVSIDLNTAGPSAIAWEDPGFLRSGYALVFGSRSASNLVTWTDNLNLSRNAPNVYEYNAREIRVLNNPASSGDWARISGTISGQQISDLLKTGPGDLELTGNNTYLGATIVHGGRLLANGNSQSSFLHKVMSGATLGGNGSVADVFVDGGGVLAPGKFANLASLLQTKSVEFQDNTSRFLAEIGGTSPGGDVISAYDQLSVTGTVTLRDADLEISILNSFVASPTDLFFLILNDGVDPINGQFAEGNSIIVGGQTFNISYTADSTSNQFTGGNDVALQLVPEPSSALFLGLGALAVVRRRRTAR